MYVCVCVCVCTCAYVCMRACVPVHWKGGLCMISKDCFYGLHDSSTTGVVHFGEVCREASSAQPKDGAGTTEQKQGQISAI